MIYQEPFEFLYFLLILLFFQINDLYLDFHVTKLPLLEKEVRGVADISEFSKYLVNPNYAFNKNQ